MAQEENRMKYCERCGALLNENGICPACGFWQQPLKQKKKKKQTRPACGDNHSGHSSPLRSAVLYLHPSV